MDKENENEKNLENNDTSMQDYEVEVAEKKGFFATIIDRIKGNNSTKLLDSGNKENYQKTNQSIGFMTGRGALRAAIIGRVQNAVDTIKKLVNGPEKVDHSNITTHVIGADDQNKNEVEQTADKNNDKQIVIPPSKSPAQSMSKEKIIPKSIINNAKTAKDVVEEKESISVEEIDIDKEIEEKTVDSKENGNKTAEDKGTIKAGNIVVGNISKEQNTSKQQDDRNTDEGR